MNNTQIRMITAQAANKEDLCVTLSYVQDALDLAIKLKQKLDNMPPVIKVMLEEKGHNTDIGNSAELIFLQSIKYIEQLIDCF